MARKRILVVDDEPDLCVYMKRLLEEAGYEVTTAQVLPSTVASLVAERYDLVTVDLKMPDMDGADVARLARAVDANMPIVAVSAYLNPIVEAQLRDLGVRHFIRKPFRALELLGAVAEALQESDPAA